MSVESAVSFAAKMIREGTYVGTALNIASSYYKVDRVDVQRGLAARSGRAQAGKPRPAKPPRSCEECQDRPAVWHGTLSWGFNHASVYMCEQCGQRLPTWYEVGRGLSGVKWTRYTPTPAPAP